MSVPEKLDPVMEGYLGYLADVGRKARRTVIDVRCTLRGASEAMAVRRPETPLWKLRLEDWLGWIEAERQAGRTPGSLAKSLSHLRGFLDYAWRGGRADRNVLDGFTIEDPGRRTEPRALSLTEAERLVRACPKATPIDRRDRLIILLLYGCGLRTQELCSLDVGDVGCERQELMIRHGKGDRERVVPIPGGVFTDLLAYLLERGGKRGALLRTEAKRRRIDSKDVCEVVRQAAERAGIAWPVTAKTLRHSYATHLMDRKVDLAVIASLMGHRSPAETGVYLHVLEGRSRDAVNRLDRKNDATKGGEQP